MGAASSQVGTLPPSDTPAYLWDTQRLTKLLVLLFLIFFSSPFTFVVLPPTNSIGLDSSSSFSVIIWRRGSWVGTCGWARFLLRDRRHDFFFFFFFFFYCISMNGHRSTERISYSGFPLLGGPADSLPSASSIVSDGTAVTLSTPSAEDHIETCDIIQCRRRWDISAGIIAVFPGGEGKKIRQQNVPRSSRRRPPFREEEEELWWRSIDRPSFTVSIPSPPHSILSLFTPPSALVPFSLRVADKNSFLPFKVMGIHSAVAEPPRENDRQRWECVKQNKE